jgi:hypothetical protein
MISQLARRSKFFENLPFLNGSITAVDELSDSFKKHLTMKRGNMSTAFFKSPGLDDEPKTLISGKHDVEGEGATCR